MWAQSEDMDKIFTRRGEMAQVVVGVKKIVHGECGLSGSSEV
jgi:hypothetical protein